jgi:two-component system sensor histidine kinase GlrK
MNMKFKQIIKASRLNRDIKITESSRVSGEVSMVTAISAAVIILLGILISYLNTRSINRPINSLQQRTKEIAKGRFEPITDITNPPEIKELADDFNLMCRRLEELDEMKIDFISHVSHELRTPLTVIKEASSMLQEGIFSDNSDKQNELLTIIHESCNRLIKSVNRILDLSRMEAKMMTYNFSKCSLISLIEQTVYKLNPLVHRKNITLQLKMQQDLPLVNVDEKRIENVLENLIGNALNVSSDKDSITIEASMINNKGRFLQIAILDTGPGIARQDLDKIFDKFQRIDSGKKTARGTGLGLPIAKHIITAHGGRLWADSEYGAGSTFYFTLPVS